MSRICFLAALALVALPVAAQVNGPAPCTNGRATLGGRTYDCNGVDLLSMVPTGVDGPFRTNGMNDVWGWTDPQTGHEYALGGTLSGTVFVDVTVPTAPLVLGKLPTASGNSDWRDIKVYHNYAFVVSEATNHGMQVFDLTRLRGLTASNTRDFTADVTYARIGSAHNLVINEETGFAYAVGFRPRGTGLPATCGTPGMMAIDIRNPLTPTFSACFSDVAQDVGAVTAPGYTHDAQCVVYRGPDATYTGRELCFAANEDVVRIFDVTDKANVRIVSRGEYPGDVYTHQGWFTEDQRYFLVNDEEDEYTGSIPFQRTMVFDMEDLDAPELAFIYTSTLTTIDHNLYVKGRYAFESNYQSGLRILDVGNLGAGQMAEVASFDTYPQGQAPRFNGQWSNYPYFASGTIIATDIENGLYVMRPTGLAVAGEAAAPGTTAGLSLSDPDPNPARDTARLSFTTDAPQYVRAVLLDALGREVAVLFDGTADGATSLDIRRDGRPAGTYVVRVTGERTAATRRIVFTR